MNQLEGKRALLYRRVSTSNQKEFGNSLSAQKSSLREFCVKKGVEVIKEFEEDYSAKDRVVRKGSARIKKEFSIQC